MIPKDLLESKDSRKTIRAKAFVAWAGSQWKYPAPLDFIAYDLEGADLAGTSMWVSHTYWEDLRWDLETSKGSSAPRDMIVGFQYLSSTPYFKEKGQEAIDRLANVEWKGNPDLLTLKQLKARDTVREGMWIVCVRLPRAVGARHIVPFNRRKDVLGSLMEMVHGGDREKNATDKLAEIKTQIEKEEHPLDGPLRKLPDGTLICKVAAHITCSTCGATGHHMTHTHDDMTMQTQEGVKLYTQDIPWLVVKDLEAAVPEIVLSDAGMAVFPTSQHRPFYSSPGSSPVTPQMLRLGSARATAVLNRATGGTEVRLSLPPNIDPLIPIHIQQDELKTIFSSSFRVRDNAGTHVYTGPEFPFNRSKGTMMSTEFLPGDMWAVGWIVLQILSGCKVEWIQDADLKRKMANCSLSQFWSDYLHLPGVPSEDPAALCAIDFVRGLLRADPAQRLSCSAALAHPFLNQV